MCRSTSQLYTCLSPSNGKCYCNGSSRTSGHRHSFYFSIWWDSSTFPLSLKVDLNKRFDLPTERAFYRATVRKTTRSNTSHSYCACASIVVRQYEWKNIWTVPVLTELVFMSFAWGSNEICQHGHLKTSLNFFI